MVWLFLALCLTAPPRVEAAQNEPSAGALQDIVVRPGDTLWAISHKYLKDPSRWDEILKHNHLPTSDPTIALPGMTLHVPVKLIKTALRAAHLSYAVNRVYFRRKETAAWKDAKMSMELFQNDSIRTLQDSKARVKFLNKELLNLEPNSMAVIKPTDDDADVVLRSGSVFAGRARIVTATARIFPRGRDTRYSASIEPDLSTKVEVFKGTAAVEAQGASVDVTAGMQTLVRPGLTPQVPSRIVRMPELEARAQEFASASKAGGGAAPNPKVAPPAPEPEADVASLRGDIQVLKIGQPIQSYHVQASPERDFSTVVFDRSYEVEERFNAIDTGLPPGAYWWRVQSVDLLGVASRFHDPHYYTVGIRRAEPENERLASMLTLLGPEENAEVGGDTVRVVGILRDERLKLEIDNRPVAVDADGNFVFILKVPVGPSTIGITISDGKGNQTRISRRVIRM